MANYIVVDYIRLQEPLNRNSLEKKQFRKTTRSPWHGLRKTKPLPLAKNPLKNRYRPTDTADNQAFGALEDSGAGVQGRGCLVPLSEHPWRQMGLR